MVQQPKREKVWASLITNLSYLPGILTLSHSLQTTETAYPFIAFYTSTFPAEGLAALHARGIRTQAVPSVQPGQSRVFPQDPRFNETWNKLIVFSLVEYDRIVLLDGDMLVRKNMDELMDMPLDEPGSGLSSEENKQERVFAASHACACNPLNKPHYPKTWIPKNCAYTSQHSDPVRAQTSGAPATAGVAMLNSGLLVVRPTISAWAEILAGLHMPDRTDKYDFPDQELLSDVFRGRWVVLPYVYNALKTLRWVGVHNDIWRDDEVKNVHYIFAKKPWHEDPDDKMDEPSRWWWEVNRQRQQLEVKKGITDGH
ncbi:nucleotide-diphospho-sugar transferase [Aspergillus novoparasiticus]|uniref:Nucleotide-diphospho-sugar transferase n=1 Tax=Aspergillus novoparasiticus TaxID=986946 RepID=A0A5N6EI57_9EURO|nr:nucleotide-diphospho-sugar transferase [Aspergillus novoparasiticus]